MGFRGICFIVYMLCSFLVRTERNYDSPCIIVLEIFICVYSRPSCYSSADLRTKRQGILYTNVFRENNDQIYFDMGCMYGSRNIRNLFLFVHSRSRRFQQNIFDNGITNNKLPIPADHSVC